MAKPTKQMLPPDGSQCEAEHCSAKAAPALIWFGRRGLRASLCGYHLGELERLLRAQGKDWGRSRKPEGWNARFYYAARRGYHAF